MSTRRHPLAVEKDVLGGGIARQIGFEQVVGSRTGPVERSARFLHPLAVAVVGVSDAARRRQPVLGVVGEGVTAVVGQVVVDSQCVTRRTLFKPCIAQLFLSSSSSLGPEIVA